MDNNWFEHTKLVAYYLWEHSGCENALNLWYASEDIASFFEQANILDTGMVDSIKKLGLGSEGYVWLCATSHTGCTYTPITQMN